MMAAALVFLKGLASPVVKALSDWRVLAVIAAVLALLWGLHETRRADGAETARKAAVAALEAAQKVSKTVAAQTAVSNAAEQKQIVVQHDIQVQTRTVIQKVPVYVSPEADTRCILPVGFVRLYNAAALGSDPDAVPDPSGRADAAASGIACSTVAEDIADNFGTARSNAEQLKALLGWITDQQALAPQP